MQPPLSVTGPPTLRTNESIQADQQKFVDDNAQRRDTQKYHNCVDDPLPLACIPLEQVSWNEKLLSKYDLIKLSTSRWPQNK